MKRVLIFLLVIISTNAYCQNTLEQYKDTVQKYVIDSTGARSLKHWKLGQIMNSMADIVGPIKDTTDRNADSIDVFSVKIKALIDSIVSVKLAIAAQNLQSITAAGATTSVQTRFNGELGFGQAPITGYTVNAGGRFNWGWAYTTPASSDAYIFDINPSITKGLSTQWLSMMRLRDRLSNSSDTTRFNLSCENGGGGAFTFLLHNNGMRLGYAPMGYPKASIEIKGISNRYLAYWYSETFSMLFAVHNTLGTSINYAPAITNPNDVLVNDPSNGYVRTIPVNDLVSKSEKQVTYAQLIATTGMAIGEKRYVTDYASVFRWNGNIWEEL